jgi:hypothetical protein
MEEHLEGELRFGGVQLEFVEIHISVVALGWVG